MSQSPLTTIPISSLSKDEQPNSNSQVHAVVTLIWPFSSRTRSCAILLADPDFRLRRSRGQVRVQLHGSAAIAVAKSGIGISDDVWLRLDGASWTDEAAPTLTPGKGLEGQLVFRDRLVLKVVISREILLIKLQKCSRTHR